MAPFRPTCLLMIFLSVVLRSPKTPERAWLPLKCCQLRSVDIPSSPFSLALCTYFVFKVSLTPTFPKLHDLSILFPLTLPDVSSKPGNAPIAPCRDSSPCTNLERHTPLSLQENTSKPPSHKILAASSFNTPMCLNDTTSRGLGSRRHDFQGY